MNTAGSSESMTNTMNLCTASAFWSRMVETVVTRSAVWSWWSWWSWCTCTSNHLELNHQQLQQQHQQPDHVEDHGRAATGAREEAPHVQQGTQSGGTRGKSTTTKGRKLSIRLLHEVGGHEVTMCHLESLWGRTSSRRLTAATATQYL